MYKKIVLLLTFIVSFIISINVVSADDELYCLYDGNKNCSHWYTLGINVCTQGMTLITYTGSGTTKTYYTKDAISNYNDIYNYPFGNTIFYYQQKNGKVVSDNKYNMNYKKQCPKCVNIVNDTVKATYELNDDGDCWNNWYPLISDDKKALEKNSSETYPVLECPYPGEKLTIKQDLSGEIRPFYDDNKIKSFQFDNNETGTGYDKSTGKFNSCPQCAKLSGSNVAFSNYNDNGKCPNRYSPLKSNDKNWKKICHYKLNGRPDIGVTLSYNETNFDLVYSNNSNYIISTFSLTPYEIWNSNSEHNCPAVLYSEFSSGSETEQGSTEQFNLKSGLRIYTNTSEEQIEEPGEIIEYPSIDNCQDLFGEDIIEIINKVMNIIRIIVPILLLVFGTTDFFTAVFSSSEDNMKEHRDRFFKRLIAAIIVFIVPVFVNLVLKLANSVWSDINSDTCVNND